MKQFRSTLILLVLAIAFGGYLYFRERGPAANAGNTVLLRTDSSQVRQIDITQSGAALSLIKNGAIWDVAANKNTVPADPDAVKSLLDNLQLVQSASVVTDTKNLQEFGLKDAADTVSVNGTTLTFGNSPSFDTSKIYVQAKNGGKSTIALLPLTLRSDAIKPFAEWRDKAVLRFDANAATQVQISAPALEATFTQKGKKDAAQWNISAPLSATADASAVSNFLTSLSNAQITNFLNDNPADMSKWALDKPQATVRITTPDGVKVLSVGKKTDGGYAAQNSFSKTIFVLPAETFDAIDRPLRHWRDTKVLSLDTGKVTQMQISARGKSITLKLSGSTWTASDSKLDKTAIGNSASDFLVGIQGLQADDFIDTPQADAVYGLDKPALQIALTSSQWQGAKTLKLATRDGKNYAQISGAQTDNHTIYVMPSDVFQAFSGALDRLFGGKK